MSAILIDHFQGSAQELYDLFKTEIESFGIPDLAFDTDTESLKLSGGGLFKAAPTEDVECLLVKDQLFKTWITAYSYGNNFYVDTRQGFEDEDLFERHQNDLVEYLEQVKEKCFRTIVSRALKSALAKYLTSKEHAVHESLDPADVFIVEG